MSKEDDRELKKALAVLISNTKKNKRFLSLTEIAQALEFAVHRLGSLSAVADRIVLSTKMLRQFSYVDRLSPNTKKLVESRQLDSVDAVTHLAMLPASLQESIASALKGGEISTADIRSVVQLYRANNKARMPDLIKRAKETRTTREFVAEFVIRGSPTRTQIIKAFEKFISPNEILRLELKGAFGRLVLTNKGKAALLKTAKRLGVSINQVIPTILEG